MKTLSKVFRFFFWSALLAGLLGGIGASVAYFYIEPTLPSIDALKDVRMQGQLRVYTRDGELMVEFGGQPAGGGQRVFRQGEFAFPLRGGALAVGASRNRSFFPDIYNDDWFYVLDAGKGLQPVAVTGTAIQHPYDPFRNPDRARAEELGDVLAEGIFWLLDQGRSIVDADQRHWTEFLARRKRFIGYVLDMVSRQPMQAGDKARMVAALKAALGRLQHITPCLCRDYLRAWACDRERWQHHIDRLPTQQSRESALRTLARRGKPPLTWHAPRRLETAAWAVRPDHADLLPALTDAIA